MNKGINIKRAVIVIVTIIVSPFLIYIIIFWNYFFSGAGISTPPNECDLRFGLVNVPGSDDALMSSRDLCLWRLALSRASVHICDEMSIYGPKLECIRGVAYKVNDPELCMEYLPGKESPGIDLERLECQWEVERDVSPLEEKAVLVAETDLNSAIEICHQYKVGSNRKHCYAQVSNKQYILKMIDLCLGNPKPNEWIACLYGEIFTILTDEELFDQFKIQVISSSSRKEEFCSLFVAKSYDPMKDDYNHRVSELEKEICHN
jgi:hypothetical protein